MAKIPVVVTQYHSLFRFHTFELKLYNELHMSEGYKIQRKIAPIKPAQQVYIVLQSKRKSKRMVH